MCVYPTIVLFDGLCNLCSRSVDFIRKRDRQGRFRYVALQSDAGKLLTRRYGLEGQIDSVVLWDKGKFYYASEAAWRISGYLIFPWNMLSLLRIVPAVLRDPFYRLIARNRYRWFGKRQYCRVAAAGELKLFPSAAELELELSKSESPE